MLHILSTILCQADVMVWNSLKKLSKEAARLPWCSMRSAFGCITLHKFIMKRKMFRDRQNIVADAIWTTSNYTETCFQFEPSASVPNFLKKKYRKRKKKGGEIKEEIKSLKMDTTVPQLWRFWEILWLVIWNRK